MPASRWRRSSSLGRTTGTAEVSADGVALVSWAPSASDPDVEGYRLTVDSGEVITVTHPISQAVVGSLDPNEAIAAEVAAYDMSGNLGAGERVAMRSPALQVIAQMPADGDTETRGNQVLVAFNQPVTEQRFVLRDEEGNEVPGTAEGLTYDLGAIIPIAEPVWGVRFVPKHRWLAPGSYTAEVSVEVDAHTARALQSVSAMSGSVLSPAGTTATYRWSFAITGHPVRTWLPLLAN